MEERKGFGTNFGFLMASVGSAVGLGNIWGFPNKMGASGGFTFLVVYLVLAVLCGFIVMVGELALGRKTGKGVVSAYHVLSKRFKWLGWLGILSPFFILFFYCALGGFRLKNAFPLFILWFVCASVVTTICTSLGVPSAMFQPLKELSKFFIIMAMAAVGLNSNVVKLVKSGGKPLLLGACCWAGITAVSLLMQRVMGLW